MPKETIAMPKESQGVMMNDLPSECCVELYVTMTTIHAGLCAAWPTQDLPYV